MVLPIWEYEGQQAWIDASTCLWGNLTLMTTTTMMMMMMMMMLMLMMLMLVMMLTRLMLMMVAMPLNQDLNA